MSVKFNGNGSLNSLQCGWTVGLNVSTSQTCSSHAANAHIMLITAQCKSLAPTPLQWQHTSPTWTAPDAHPGKQAMMGQNWADIGPVLAHHSMFTGTHHKHNPALIWIPIHGVDNSYGVRCDPWLITMQEIPWISTVSWTYLPYRHAPVCSYSVHTQSWCLK